MLNIDYAVLSKTIHFAMGYPIFFVAMQLIFSKLCNFIEESSLGTASRDTVLAPYSILNQFFCKAGNTFSLGEFFGETAVNSPCSPPITLGMA